MHLYMIHKIEIYPHYTYPIITSYGNETTRSISHEQRNNCKDDVLNMVKENNQTTLNVTDEMSSNNTVHLLPPYRTVSHYGFNYPSTYMPNISLHPSCSITPVDLQRQKVISFIKRLNLEAQANCQHLSYFNKTRTIETGKEENIYVNTTRNRLDKISSVTLDTLKTDGSFISVAEIQLNASNKMSSNLGSVKSGESQKESHKLHINKNSKSNQIDLLSTQFSSLLSISGSYPGATHSNVGDVENDHFTIDSGDNSSNFESHSSRKCSYLQRNFIPRIIDSQHSIIDFRDADGEDELDPHKPESEQTSKNEEHKHVTLTLNSLKRKASDYCNKKEKSNKSLLLRTQFSDANSSCNSSTTTSTAIEIHININIRNSDCVKNLKNREQEFKSKLEKVIDDEISLITQELAIPTELRADSKEDNIATINLNPSHRCLSAPDSIFLYGREASCTEADRQSQLNFKDTPYIASPRPLSTTHTNLYTLQYTQTVAMLEHELELLLNNIIRNICDCKTKISQISEDIRTATLHVGPLNDKTCTMGNSRN